MNAKQERVPVVNSKRSFWEKLKEDGDHLIVLAMFCIAAAMCYSMSMTHHLLSAVGDVSLLNNGTFQPNLFIFVACEWTVMMLAIYKILRVVYETGNRP